MKTGVTKSQHPAVSQLAQFAGSDLPWMQTAAVRRHLRSCEGCGDYVFRIRAAQTELRREAGSQTLTGFEAIADLPRLEQEMLGNISVGLAAARCVDEDGRPRPWRRVALVAAALGALFILGWWTHIPAEQTRQLMSTLQRWARGEMSPQPLGTVMRSSPDGIFVRSQGLTLTMRHPRSAVVSMAGVGTMRASFVDEDSGQVTISSVYGQ